MYTHVTNNGEMNVRSLFQKAGLLYEVEKRRLSYDANRSEIEAAFRDYKNKKIGVDEALKRIRIPSTIKRNHTLKVVDSATEFDGVSKDWDVYQNTELAEWTEQMVEKFGLEPYAAGSFEGGEDAGKIGWFQARLPGEHTILKTDRYDPLLTVTNQQKYGTTWGGGFSSTRIICRNTVHAAEASLQIIGRFSMLSMSAPRSRRSQPSGSATRKRWSFFPANWSRVGPSWSTSRTFSPLRTRTSLLVLPSLPLQS
jgi:hypothetical protein